MKKTQPHNWPYVIYYTVGSILFLGLLFFVAEMFFPSTSAELIPRRDDLSARFITNPSWDTRPQDIPERNFSKPAREKILLPLNHEKTIGKSKIIYRGLEGSAKFKIDVVIPELDPQAFYGYRFLVDDARQGFRLGGHNFELISARKSALRIWYIKK
jgi:hypothetical protein